ncbi:MAG: hypothetical protein ACRDFW_11470, partial [bacterium]
MRRIGIKLSLGIGLLVAWVQGCDQVTEPHPRPLFNHVARADGFSIPFDVSGRPMTVSLTVVSKNHPFNWVLLVVHPLDGPKLPPEPNLDPYWDTFVTPAYQTVLGPYPQGALYQIAAIGCNPDFAAAPGFTCFHARLELSGSGSHYTVGAELNDDQSAFDDLVFTLDLTLVQGDTLAVDLTLAPDSVGPVLAPLFNAVSQVAESNRRQQAQRTDTVRVHVRARFLPSGTPAAFAVVRLVSAPIFQSGGHAHDAFTRPVGTFFRVGDDVNVPTGGVRSQIRLNLPESGDTVLMYRTSGLSGRERVVAAVTIGGFSKAPSDTVTVRWPGLVAMDRVGTTYEFKNQDPNVSPTQRHGNVNNWIEPTFRTRVLDAFQRYFDAVPAEERFPNPAPGGGLDTRLVITDVSLEWGGLFDVDGAGPWHN